MSSPCSACRSIAARSSKARPAACSSSNPGEMLRATASAALIAALRSEGKFREGNRIGKQLLAEGDIELHAHHRLLRDGLQPRRDGGGPRPGARVRRSARSTSLPTSSSSFRSPRSAGCTTSGKRVRAGGRVPGESRTSSARRRRRSPTSAWRFSPPATRSRRAAPSAARAASSRGSALSKRR